ncbi:hypothetical protein AXF42_Ash003097 [Apostasia shenzhenica]|uniref:UspA domain-containing protein n=1 Tax=Apostasia shenzhenica TaxID=1088818 RepID=A0A2I0A840_9ASPA|nr:hypothetical protein AXF42_Ash003097 [Apostasia shenzhenica]
MASYGNGEAFLRQLSTGGWDRCSSYGGNGASSAARGPGRWRKVEEGEAVVVKKRLMVVIDQTGRAKQAMMWALTHVANKGDLLTLLHVVPSTAAAAGDVPQLANSLGTLCKACRPEVEVEALVIQGPKLATVLSQVRKLEASVLVLGQGKSSSFPCLFKSSSEEFVENCIKKADCLTVAVKKQSKGVGGYLVSTRWQKNFWLLA